MDDGQGTVNAEAGFKEPFSATQFTGTGPLNLSAPPDFLIGSTESLQGFELSWSDFSNIDQLPSSNFFDVGFSLAEMAQLHASLPSAGHSTAVAEPYRGHWLDTTTEPLNSAVLSRLPSLEPTVPGATSKSTHDQSSTAYRQSSTAGQTQNQCPWRISPDDYQQLKQKVTARASMIPNSFTFPSRQTISRYLEGYFRGLNVHMPFLHTPSLSHSALGLELVLSLAAVGAIYRFEHAKAVELYRVAKTLIIWRLDELHNESVSQVAFNYPEYAKIRRSSKESGMHDRPSPILSHGQEGLRLLQGLLVLMAITMWGKRELIRESLSMASQVATLVRDLGINTPEQTLPQNTAWEDWIQMEERRRTLFVAYVLFSLQCTAFDVPPMILNQEVCLNLPSTAAEWRAPSASEWAECHKHTLWPPQSFQNALEQLLSGTSIHHKTPLSAFGNYVLIHGLSIQVFLARNAADPFSHPESSLSTDYIERMEAALRAWQKSWEATHESTLDPSSPKGPLGFNSTAVLRLVYIRLNANIGPSRQLLTRDPVEIARAFADSSIISIGERSSHLDRAVLQCIYALSVPVRVGIAFVARTLTLNWSCQHAVSNLECAFLLTHWLRALATSIETFGMESLRSDEHKMLEMVISLIRETDLADSLLEHSDHASRVRRVAASTARLWAETFKGFHVFEVVYVIGESLSIAAEALEHG